MATHLEQLIATHNIGDDYEENSRVYVAAVRLQLAILAAMSQNLRGMLPKRQPKLIDGLTPEEAKLASDRNGKIPAIKKVRERKHTYNPDGTIKQSFGLDEAKNLVEGWMEKHLGFRYWPATTLNEPAYNPYDR